MRNSSVPLLCLSLAAGTASACGGGESRSSPDAAASPPDADPGDARALDAMSPMADAAAPVTPTQRLSTHEDHTCMLGTPAPGEITCWGFNFYGQLGYGHTSTVGTFLSPSDAGPVPVGGSVAQVGPGRNHTCAVLDGGELKCWGWAGDHGLLGYGNLEDIGDDEPASDVGAVPIGAEVAAVAAGATFSCALLAGGEVKCWGANGPAGRLGCGHEGESIGDDEAASESCTVELGAPTRALTVSFGHTCALATDESLRCWGDNTAGRLGYGHERDIGDDESPATAGAVEVGGPVAQVVSGTAHTCALLVSGEVRCWGFNSRGQLGLGHTDRIGDDELPSSVAPVEVGGPVVRITAGEYHTCALLETGAVRCWGHGGHGRLGYGDEEPIGDDETPADAGDVPVGGPALEIAAGGAHTCALLEGGGVRCWGISFALGSGADEAYGDDEPAADAPLVPL